MNTTSSEHGGYPIDMIAHGDCIEWLRTLPDGCADMVLTDPPYGTMACDWDKKVDMEALFGEMWRVLKHNGALLMFAQNPFAAECIMLNKGTFRYEWVWRKTQGVGFANASRMPMRTHELCLVFYRALPTYNAVPITNQRGKPYMSKCQRKSGGAYPARLSKAVLTQSEVGDRYPQDVVTMPNVKGSIHPTQKPQELCEMLIRQYTKWGEMVLDPFAGSGTTAAAAKATGRHYLSCEINASFHASAVERLRSVSMPLPGTEPIGLVERKLAKKAAASG